MAGVDEPAALASNFVTIRRFIWWPPSFRCSGRGCLLIGTDVDAGQPGFGRAWSRWSAVVMRSRANELVRGWRWRVESLIVDHGLRGGEPGTCSDHP